MGESHCLCGKSIDGIATLARKIGEVVTSGEIVGEAFGDVVDGEGVVYHGGSSFGSGVRSHSGADHWPAWVSQ
jgi:hypothetical protein